MRRRDAGNYVDSTALLLDSNIRNSVCTPAKLPCRRVEVGYELKKREFVIKTHERSETFVLQENQNIVNYH
jgi:hypothetical protein